MGDVAGPHMVSDILHIVRVLSVGHVPFVSHISRALGGGGAPAQCGSIRRHQDGAGAWPRVWGYMRGELRCMDFGLA